MVYYSIVNQQIHLMRCRITFRYLAHNCLGHFSAEYYHFLFNAMRQSLKYFHSRKPTLKVDMELCTLITDNWHCKIQKNNFRRSKFKALSVPSQLGLFKLNSALLLSVLPDHLCLLLFYLGDFRFQVTYRMLVI